ncbi:MAG: LuxR family transcriptional regulator [Rubrivivax sp.]|nr:MAG: LuxR family transcriptional regulator [Rubrivivax sp.]
MARPELPLLERDTALAGLRADLAALAQGEGRCVLLGGDAGLGKTRLLRTAERESAGIGTGIDWAWGACEPLIAPLPLGPLLDMLPRLPADIASLLRRAAPAAELFAALLALARRSRRPCVWVFEDLHWADGATLDLLRFLSRRIAGTRVLLCLTWRGGELGPAHPLRAVLAGLAGQRARSIKLAPLSQAAVATLAARAGRPSAGVFEASGGNPFFVTELLDAPPADGLPASVRDAMLARVARLSAPARELLNVASVSPGPLETAVLAHVCGLDPAALAEVVTSDLLQPGGDGLRFAHELTRLTVLEALGPRAPALHAAVFDALGDRGAAPARLVHHAEHAGLAHAVARLAPRAAEQAAAGGAHRQAAALLGLALSHRAQLPPAQVERLARARALECLLTGQIDEAAQAGALALAEAETGARPLARAEHLSLLARVEWTRGRAAAGLVHAEAAVALLGEHAPDSPALARALASRAQLHLLDDDSGLALAGAAKALALFSRLDDRTGELAARITLASARIGGSDEAPGVAELHAALAQACATGQEEQAARAWTNLASAALVAAQYEALDRLCAAGLAFCEARDLDLFAVPLRVRQACGEIARGDWPAGEARLRQLQVRSDLNALQREQVEHLLALQAARRQQPQALAYWQQLADGRRRLALRPWFMSVEVQQVEVAALSGDTAQARRLAEVALDGKAARLGPWRRAQLLVWLARLGQPRPAPADAPAACARELAGDHRAAARAWCDLGCPYQQALALLGGDAQAVTEALKMLQGLGAELAAKFARGRLRALGAGAVGRGRYGHARQDPLGLTARERAVLDLLVQGHSNRAIAAALHRSERTVEHHVAALFLKLGVKTRQDAIRRAKSG